jgi:hypothetical protein
MDAMTLGEAVDQVKILLGFRRDLDTSIKQQLNYAQVELEKGPTLPWFLLSEVNTTLTTVGGRRIIKPVDFIREYEEGALWYAPTGEDEIALEKADNDFLMAHYGTTATGKPEAYSLDGNYFKIYPLPDAQYTIKLLYYKHDVSISSLGDSSTNQWLTHGSDCLIGRAGRVLASGLRDRDAKAEFSDMEQRGRLTMYNENEARKHVNRTYQIGGPEV